MKLRPAPVWEALRGLASEYIRAETSSSIGKLNLILVLILAVLVVLAFVPPLVVTVLRIVLQRPSPEWTLWIPVVAIVCVSVVAVISMLLVYKEGSRPIVGRGSHDDGRSLPRA